MYYLYVLYTAEADKYYVGQSSDPWKRLEWHNTNSGDTYTGKYNSWELVAVFFVSEERAQAVKIERYIKRQKSRRLIEKLLNPNFELTGELAQLVRVPHVRD
jgi:putative endonuclease